MDEKQLKKYFIRDIKWGWDYQGQAVFQFLVKAAECCRNGVVLDAGAGTMRYKPFFTNAIYISQEHVAGIEKKEMGDIEYDIVQDLTTIPLKDECLDVVMSTSVIEHLRYPVKFFEEAFRVIKGGGRLFVHVPFVYNEHEAPFDFQRPTRYGLERWFVDAGFEDVKIEPGTSSTATATHFLPKAILNDVINRKNIVSKGSLFLLIYWPTRLFCKLLKFVIDKGPHGKTNFPTGWIAVGKKPGNSDAYIYRNKEEFLRLARLV